MRVGTLGYAILGLLATTPRTGYELGKAMKAPIGYLWTARHSQIYPTLARLESDGLVSAQAVSAAGPRDTKRYSMTDLGRKKLSSWVDSPLVETNRSELLLRVRCLWLISPEQAQGFVLGHRAALHEQMQAYAYEEADFARLGDEIEDFASQYFGQYATLRYGIAHVNAAIAWCDWLLDRLPAQAVSPLRSGEAAPTS